MEKYQLSELQTKALTLMGERDKAADLFIVHVASDVVPSSKTGIFRFFAASRRTPNDPRHMIVLDEKGSLVDLAALRKREGVNLLGQRELKVARARLRPLGSADALVTISPTENDLVLNPGDTHGPEVITVFVPKSTPAQKVDVYFLADTTSSMGPVLSQVASSSGAILTALAGLGVDFAYGVGNYRDFPTFGSYAFQHQLSPTADAAAVQAAINAWSPAGGGDLPEGQLFALDRIATDQDGAIGWRFNAKRILVWFGDAPGHDPVCAAISGLADDITTGSVIGKLAAANITAIAITSTTGSGGGLDADPTAGANDYTLPCGTPAGFPGQATTIATATGGTHLTDVEPTAIVNVIIDALMDAAQTINRVELDPAGPAADFITAITPGSGFGPLSGTMDHELRFEVTFRGEKPCSNDGPQVFDGFIAVKVDGNVVGAQKRIRVTVPQCVRYVEIEGAPSAAVGRRDLGLNTTRQINVFARGTSDQLLRCSHNGDPTAASNWSWQDLGRPGGPGGTRVSDAPFGVTEIQESINRLHDHIHAFVRGSDGHLHEITWDGSAWSGWVDHNQPYWQATVAASPTVDLVSLRFDYDPNEPGYIGRTTLFAYVWGSDGMLYHFEQIWHPHRSPPAGVTVASVPGVPGFQDWFAQPFAYALVAGNDNRLYVRHATDFGAASWNWLDLGRPNSNVGVGWLRRPGIVWFFYDQQHRLYTFVTGTDGHLWVHVWRGVLRNTDLGFWADQGIPATGVTIGSAASVVTYPHNGNDQIYAFVRGSDNHLHVHFWDAANSVWVWRDLGQPLGVNLRGDPSAVVCEFPGVDPLYVLVRGNDDYLHMCHLDSGATTPVWVILNM